MTSASANTAVHGAFSEVGGGRLRKVLVCAPGLAHRRLTPTNCDKLLWLPGTDHAPDNHHGQGDQGHRAHGRLRARGRITLLPVIKMNHLIVSRGWGQRLPGPVCSRLGLRAPNATSCLVGISPVMSGR